MIEQGRCLPVSTFKNEEDQTVQRLPLNPADPSSPEDPSGVGIEHAGRLGVEGDIERYTSLFFPKIPLGDSQGTALPGSTDENHTAVLVPEFSDYTFLDIAFRRRRPSIGQGEYLTVRNVVTIPISYAQLKAKFEARGLKEGDDQNKGEAFHKADEIVLTQKPDVVLFPKIDALQHQFSYRVGWGQYIVLCGEQVEGGEQVSLIEIRRGTIDYPQNPH